MVAICAKEIRAERGWGPAGEREIEHGALYVGSPETVAQKLGKDAASKV